MERDIHTHFGSDWTWDDYRLPASWWEHTERHDTHWLAGTSGYYPYAYLCRRILSIPWVRVMAVVPTCGFKRCVNPSHLCLTLKAEEELSVHEDL